MGKRTLWLLAFWGLSITLGMAQSNVPQFNFNLGGGFGIGRGDVGGFVGNSPFGVAGAGLNFTRMFGFNAEYMYYDLPLRPSVANSQSLPGGGGSLQAISLDGLVRPPVHVGRFRVYGIFGVGFYDRRVSAQRETLIPGTVCQPAWTAWWGITCVNGFIQNQSQTLSSFSKIAGGYNYGGGITYQLNHLHNAKLYFEYRHHKAYQSDAASVVWPITVGLRW